MKPWIFLILFTTSLSYSQIIIQDLETKNPVSYATVSFGDGNGLFADDEGMFVFTKKLYPDVDSLFISALGYKSIQLSTNGLPKIIKLQIEADQLDEVIISASDKRKFRIIKHKPVIHDVYDQCWLPTIESEIAVFVPKQETKDQQLFKVQFPIALEAQYRNKSRNSSTGPKFSTLYKVQFYRNEEGLPGKRMTSETIVILITETDGDYYELDVDNFNIMLPDNGLFVGFQVLGYADKTGKLLPNKKYKEVKGRNGMVKIPTNFRPLLPFTDEWADYRTFTKRAFINGNQWKAFVPNYGIESRLLDKGFANYGIGVTLKTFKD